MASNKILSASGLSVGYRNGRKTITVLSELNLDLHIGELVCLLGANGIGKTTLLRTLSGVQPPLAGMVEIDGHDMAHCSHKDLSRLISIVYTDRTLAGALTVRELVSIGRHPHTGFFGRLDQEDNAIVDEAMAAVGIEGKAGAYMATLSDGERQKVMIARALAQQTPVIILDEPTAFLDAASRIETMRLLHDLAHNHSKAVLLSSHDISQSLSLASRLWLLRDDGSMVAGVTEDLILAGGLSDLFLDRDVAFNLLTGDFLAKPRYTKSVALVCDDAVLQHWIVNALDRNGICIDPMATTTIVATTPDHLSVGDMSFQSIAALLDYLIN